MPLPKKRMHEHFQLDPLKIRCAQRVLKTKTPIETIERALDPAIAEYESNSVAVKAHERFIKSGIEIKDVYRTLEN